MTPSALRRLSSSDDFRPPAIFVLRRLLSSDDFRSSALFRPPVSRGTRLSGTHPYYRTSLPFVQLFLPTFSRNTNICLYFIGIKPVKLDKYTPVFKKGRTPKAPCAKKACPEGSRYKEGRIILSGSRPFRGSSCKGKRIAKPLLRGPLCKGDAELLFPWLLCVKGMRSCFSPGSFV